MVTFSIISPWRIGRLAKTPRPLPLTRLTSIAFDCVNAIKYPRLRSPGESGDHSRLPTSARREDQENIGSPICPGQNDVRWGDRRCPSADGSSARSLSGESDTSARDFQTALVAAPARLDQCHDAGLDRLDTPT